MVGRVRGGGGGIEHKKTLFIIIYIYIYIYIHVVLQDVHYYIYPLCVLMFYAL